MATVRSEAAAAAPPRGRTRAWLTGLRTRPAIAGAAASIALVLVGWSIGLQLDDRGPVDPRVVVPVSAGGSEGIEARVLYLPFEDQAIVTLENLRPPSEGEGYELWVIDDGRVRSAGFLLSERPGGAIRVASRLRGADALAVTREALTSDRTAPTTPILVRIPLPA